MPSYTTPGVYVEEVPTGGHALQGVSTSVLAVVDWFPSGEPDEPVEVASWKDFKAVFGRPHASSVGSYALRQFFANGGTRAWVVRVAGPAAGPDEAALEGGLQTLRGLPSGTFNLLALPAAAELDPTSATRVYEAATRLCSERRAFLLIDVPKDLNGHPDADVVAWVDGLRHENAAAYFPRLLVPDPLQRRTRKQVAPSGTVAGVIARTDAERGVWKAPAGLAASMRRTRLVEELDDARNDVLNPAGVNALRKFNEQRPVIWGSRTTVGDNASGSEWKYIPVRRLALFLEESLSQGLGWAVFEPNDEQLWSRLRITVEGFLDGLFRQGALQGPAAKEAYSVRCDGQTTSPGNIANGIVNVVVMFAPLKPAEFVVIKLSLVAGSQVRNVGSGPASLADLGLTQEARTQLSGLAQHARGPGGASAQSPSSGPLPGVGALFAGARGAGKTRAAELLAGELGLELHRVDLATTVSKYIGETEKNLSRAFSAAQRKGAILFFDEADALFGKRSNVSDAHDRHANSEVSYLLQRLEEYQGLAILASNKREQLDPDFLRRLNVVVEFPPPDGEADGKADGEE